MVSRRAEGVCCSWRPTPLDWGLEDKISRLWRWKDATDENDVWSKIWRQTQEGKRVLRRTLDMTQERDTSGRGNAAILTENWPTQAREPRRRPSTTPDSGNNHKANATERVAAPSSVRRPRKLNPYWHIRCSRAFRVDAVEQPRNWTPQLTQRQLSCSPTSERRHLASPLARDFGPNLNGSVSSPAAFCSSARRTFLVLFCDGTCAWNGQLRTRA